MKSAAPVTPDAPTIKVLLIGRRPLSLAGLRAFIDAQPDCEVIGQRGHSAVPMVLSSDAPDVAVVDHGTRDTLESLTVLAEGHSHRLRTVVLTSGTDDETLLASAFRGGGGGGRGVVSTSDAPDSLIAAIHRVHAGEVWLDPARTGALITSLLRTGNRSAPPLPALSDRDRQIVTLVAEGLKNKQIAERLRVSEATIRNRLTRIFKTLGVKGRFELVVYACQHELVKLPRARRGKATGTLRLV